MTRTAIVTGAGSGIGKATADLLKQQGLKVVGIDLKGSDIDADLSTAEGRTEAVKQALEMTGGVVDVVVTSAGISAPIALTTSVNYFGTVEVVEQLREALAKSEAPRVALVASFSSLQDVSDDLVEAMLSGDEAKALEISKGLEEQGPEVGFLTYSSSKRAVNRWMRTVAPTAEWAGAGIAINSVGPGVVATPMAQDLIDGQRDVLDAILPMPLNSHTSPEAIAHVLAFLVSEGNTHMTGQALFVDGGSEIIHRGEDIWSQFAPARPLS